MDLVVALFLGGIAGWLFTLAAAGNAPGLLANVLVGVLGSLVARGMTGLLGLTVWSSPGRWLVSLAGAVSALALYLLAAPRSRRT